MRPTHVVLLVVAGMLLHIAVAWAVNARRRDPSRWEFEDGRAMSRRFHVGSLQTSPVHDHGGFLGLNPETVFYGPSTRGSADREALPTGWINAMNAVESLRRWTKHVYAPVGAILYGSVKLAEALGAIQ